SAEDVLAREPSLKPLLKGGVFFPTEAHAEPLETVRALVREFEAAGGRIQSRTEAFDFEFENGRISTVHTTRGRIRADLVVLATGTWSRAMARGLQVRVPILGGKGYSLTIENFQKKPTHPIMIIERKIAVTPRADS